jgi:hypothetical protein
MDAMTKEILGRLGRLEERAFTPGENMRFFLESANRMMPLKGALSEETIAALAKRAEEEATEKALAESRRGELIYRCRVHGKQPSGRLGFGEWHGITEAPPTHICGHGKYGSGALSYSGGCKETAIFVRIEG